MVSNIVVRTLLKLLTVLPSSFHSLLIAHTKAFEDGHLILRANVIIGLSFVPETKDLSLEQLDARFSISSKKHAQLAVEQCMYVVRHFILKRKSTAKSHNVEVVELPPLTRKKSPNPQAEPPPLTRTNSV